MTTKSKTRKAPVAKRVAHKAASKQASGEPKRKVSVRNLVSRWHWLEADQTHRANIAQTEKEYERLIAIHNDEQMNIEGVLAQAIPKCFLDACCLLEFATERAEQGGYMADHAEIDMLKNGVAGLRVARRDELEAARNAGMEEMRRAINFVTENASKMIAAELDIRRSA